MSGLHAKKIVAPVDLSDESLAALSTAVDMAASPSDVHTVHVIPELRFAEPGVIWQEIDDRGSNRR
jgi:nucleotide-binding universal stress UspA family protein